MEELYGAVLPPFRKDIFLATKSPQRNRRRRSGSGMSLRTLKTDHVDRWQMHQVSTMDESSRFLRPAAPSRLLNPRESG